MLAEYLRRLRRTAGLSYGELAVRSNCSAAHLKRAAGGRTLPAHPVMLAYVGGCTGDSRHRLYTELMYGRAVRAVEQAKRDFRRSGVRPDLQSVEDVAGLSQALRNAWAQRGRPVSRTLALSSRWLPRSTAHAITTGRVPRDLRQYVAFLQTCGIDDESLAPWFRAWFKVFGRLSARDAATTLETLEASYDALRRPAHRARAQALSSSRASPAVGGSGPGADRDGRQAQWLRNGSQGSERGAVGSSPSVDRST
ncbi:helix-turn-helix domain-containing protein [Streptomyces sp. NBC_00285]|uniref:helix-turn-helix domain-containing protein n=1 Tax=Streptomyces sp. NBC_00285 TaxID=2975700 RepID=UPI003FA6B1BE